jgi:hypothetical protein
MPIGGSSRFHYGLFTLEAGGSDIGGTNDQFHLAHAALSGDGVITARYVPQISSQLTKLGLTLRDSPAADAPHVSLLLTPGPTDDVEEPGWKAILSVRATPGANTTVSSATANLRAPFVTYGRLTGHCWLRLERAGNRFTGSISADGETWKPVGTVNQSLKSELLAGLAACSRIKATTTVKFDNVAVTGNR